MPDRSLAVVHHRSLPLTEGSIPLSRFFPANMQRVGPFRSVDVFHGRTRDGDCGVPDALVEGACGTLVVVLDGSVAVRDACGDTEVTGPGVVWTPGVAAVHRGDAAPGYPVRGVRIGLTLAEPPAATCVRSPPVVTGERWSARVLTGALGEVRSPIAIEPTVLDIQLKRGATLRLDAPNTRRVFVLPLYGQLRTDPDSIEPGSLAVYHTNGDEIALSTTSTTARVLVGLGTRPP